MFAYENGDEFLKDFYLGAAGKLDPFILIVEGSIPNEEIKTEDHYLGNAVHLFLSLLAVLILSAAAIATVEIVLRDFPQLWRQGNEYDALHQIIQSLLILAIAAELGCCCSSIERARRSRC